MLGDELNVWQEYLKLFDLDLAGSYVTGSIFGYQQHLELEWKVVKDAWLNTAFSELDDRVLSRYFIYHQKEIQVILSKLSNYLGNHQVAPELVPLAESLTEKLMELSLFLETYFVSFLNAELAAVDTVESNRSVKIKPEKLIIKLSVAQLACFVKLFTELDCFPSNSVVEIVRFFAANFQTKVRSIISAKSLSKEYYSVSQSTALKCKVMLEKMIELINQQFFPVTLIISACSLIMLR